MFLLASTPAVPAVEGLSREARLLLATVRAGDDDRIRELCAQGVDWGRMLAAASAEGALPIFLRRIREVAPQRIPASVTSELRQVERAAEFRLAYLGKRLDDVVRTLTGAGIRVLLLKGSALAGSVYASVAERPMADIDLLVEREQAAEAHQRLLASGWSPRFAPEFDEWYGTMHHLPPMVDTQSPSLQVCLELHTDIFPQGRNPFGLAVESLWAGSRPAPGMPAGTMIPSLEQLLLHCCLHFAWLHQCSGSGWRTFRDIDALARTGELDWEAFVRMAQQSGGGACVYWPLRLARVLADVDVPTTVLERLQPDLPDSVRRMFEHHFAHESLKSEQVCPSERVRAAIWRAAVIPRRGEWDRAAARRDPRPWHLLRRAEAPVGMPPVDDGAPRPVFSPTAWLRYFRSIV